MTGLGVSGSSESSTTHLSVAPADGIVPLWVFWSKSPTLRDAPQSLSKSRRAGLTWVDDGTLGGVRGDGSTLWVFWNKSALSCGQTESF